MTPAEATKNLTSEELAAVVKTRLDNEDTREEMLDALSFQLSMNDLDRLTERLP